MAKSWGKYDQIIIISLYIYRKMKKAAFYGKISILGKKGIFLHFSFPVTKKLDLNRLFVYFTWFGNKKDELLVSLFHFITYKDPSSVILSQN